jgi:hypothetical protein
VLALAETLSAHYGKKLPRIIDSDAQPSPASAPCWLTPANLHRLQSEGLTIRRSLGGRRVLNTLSAVGLARASWSAAVSDVDEARFGVTFVPE